MSDTKTNIIGKDVKLHDNGDGTYSLVVNVENPTVNILALGEKTDARVNDPDAEEGLTAISALKAIMYYIKDNLETIDHTHKKIHDGDYYTVYKQFSAVANNGYARLRLKSGNLKKNHIVMSISGSVGLHQIKLFKNTTYTVDGTAVVPVNSDYSISTDSDTDAFHTPTVNVLGTEKLAYTIGDGSTTPTRVLGSSNSRNEIIQGITSDLLIEVQNLTGSASNITIIAEFYEEDN